MTLMFGFAENVEAVSNRKEEEHPARAPEEQQKPLASSEWKIPTLINKHASPEVWVQLNLWAQYD